MPFTDSEFNDLLSGLKADASGTANEATVIIFMESPIWRRMTEGSGINMKALFAEADAKNLGFPHLTIDASPEMRARIDRHFGSRSDPDTPARPLSTQWRLGHGHVFQINGSSLYCASMPWPDQNLTLGTFTNEQLDTFCERAAVLFRERSIKIYGDKVIAKAHRASIAATTITAAPGPDHAAAAPGTLEHEVNALILDGNVIRLPSFELKHYPQIKTLLTKAGGRYQRSTFVFKSEDEARVGLEAAGVRRDLRKETQFFPTPDHVSDLAFCFFDHRELRGARALEPSAGDGAMADKLRDHNVSEVVAVENWPGRAQQLRDKGHQVIEKDFLEVTPNDTGLFSIIAMNPPFTGGQDIAHVSHALSFLTPQGKLSAIVSAGAGTQANQKSRAFGRLLALLDDPVSPLPADAFKVSGTSVATKNVRISMEELLTKMEAAGVTPESLGLDLHRQLQMRNGLHRPAPGAVVTRQTPPANQASMVAGLDPLAAPAPRRRGPRM